MGLMRAVNVFCVVGLSVAGCDSGLDYENTTPYPGPCSSQAYWTDGSVQDATFEYDQGGLVRLLVEAHSHSEVLGQSVSSFDLTWTRGPDGTLSTMRRLNTFEGHTFEWAWTFAPDFVTETFEGDLVRRWDAARYLERPAPGSAAVFPFSDLGLIEDDGVPCTWTTEGVLLVRTCANQRATFALDASGRIATTTIDLTDDDLDAVTVNYTFDGDLFVEKSIDNSTTPSRETWRYDLAGNVASMDGVSLGERYVHEEYDYGCW